MAVSEEAYRAAKECAVAYNHAQKAGSAPAGSVSEWEAAAEDLLQKTYALLVCVLDDNDAQMLTAPDED